MPRHCGADLAPRVIVAASTAGASHPLCAAEPRATTRIAARYASASIGRSHQRLPRGQPDKHQKRSLGWYRPHTSRRAPQTSPTVARARERFLHRIQHVLRAVGRGRKRRQRAVDGRAVPVGAELRQPRDLLRLDRRIDTQRLVGLLLVDREPVDADHDPRARVDLLGDPVRRRLDLPLLEAGLDRVDRRAVPGDLRPIRANVAASISSVIASTTYEPANGSTVAVRSVSYASTCWVRSASRAAFSVGSAIASS